MNLLTKDGAQAVLDRVREMSGVELTRFLRDNFPLVEGVADALESIPARRAFTAWLVSLLRLGALRATEMDWENEALQRGPMGGCEKPEGDDPEGEPRSLVRPMRFAFSKPRTLDQAADLLLTQGREKGLDEWSDDGVVKARLMGFVAACREGRYEMSVVDGDGGTVLLTE